MAHQSTLGRLSMMRGSSKHMNPEQENAQKTDEEIDQMTVQEASVVIKAARLSVPEWRLSSGQERRGSDHLQQVRQQAKIARDALLTKVHYQEAKPTVQALKARQDATNEVKAVQGAAILKKLENSLKTKVFNRNEKIIDSGESPRSGGAFDARITVTAAAAVAGAMKESLKDSLTTTIDQARLTRSPVEGSGFKDSLRESSRKSSGSCESVSAVSQSAPLPVISPVSGSQSPRCTETSTVSSSLSRKTKKSATISRTTSKRRGGSGQSSSANDDAWDQLMIVKRGTIRVKPPANGMRTFDEYTVAAGEVHGIRAVLTNVDPREEIVSNRDSTEVMFIPGDVLRDMIGTKVVNYVREDKKEVRVELDDSALQLELGLWAMLAKTEAMAELPKTPQWKHIVTDPTFNDKLELREYIERGYLHELSKMENVKMQKEYPMILVHGACWGLGEKSSRVPLSESDVDRYASPQIIHGGDKIDVQPPREGEQYGDEAIESASHCWVLALPPTKDTHKTSWDVQPELRNAQFGDEFGGCEVPEGCLRKNVSQRCVKIYDIMLGKHRIVTKTSKFKGAIRESILAGRMNKLLKIAKRESNESESVGTPPSEPADESERASPSVIAEENV